MANMRGMEEELQKELPIRLTALAHYINDHVGQKTYTGDTLLLAARELQYLRERQEEYRRQIKPPAEGG